MFVRFGEAHKQVPPVVDERDEAGHELAAGEFRVVKPPQPHWFFNSSKGVRKGGVAASAGGAAGRAALVEEGWLAGAFAPVERRGASGRAASGGQRRGRVIEPVRQRLDQKGQEKMGQNPRLCGALIEAWRFF